MAKKSRRGLIKGSWFLVLVGYPPQPAVAKRGCYASFLPLVRPKPDNKTLLKWPLNIIDRS